MNKEKRFERIYKQGAGSMEIWVDRDGKPVITAVKKQD